LDWRVLIENQLPSRGFMLPHGRSAHVQDSGRARRRVGRHLERDVDNSGYDCSAVEEDDLRIAEIVLRERKLTVGHRSQKLGLGLHGSVAVNEDSIVSHHRAYSGPIASDRRILEFFLHAQNFVLAGRLRADTQSRGGDK